MDGLVENVPVSGFLHGILNIPGTIKAFIRDLHGLPGNPMPVLFGGVFLLIFTGQIDLKIIIRTIKKCMAEISRVILLIAMVKELDIFFVGFANKSQAVVNLVLGNGEAVVKMGKNRGDGFGF